MTLLLLSTRPEDESFFAKIAQENKMEMRVYDKGAEVADALAELSASGSAVPIVVDASDEAFYKDFEKAFANKFGLFSAAINPNHIFYLGDGEFHELPHLSTSDIFGHFISRKYSDAVAERISAMIEASISEEAPTLEKYLGKDAKIQRLSVTKSGQKKPIVESLKTQLIKGGFNSRIAAAIATAADEVIMNAIFDAPVDETGKPLYAQTPRNTQLDLGEAAQIEVVLGFKGDLFGIAVIDKHGSIDKKKLLSHIGKSYQNDEFKVRTTVAGAGLGLSNVFRTCGGLIFSCEMGAKTQVMLLYRRTKSYKEFKDQFRFLSTLMYFS